MHAAIPAELPYPPSLPEVPPDGQGDASLTHVDEQVALLSTREPHEATAGVRTVDVLTANLASLRDPDTHARVTAAVDRLIGTLVEDGVERSAAPVIGRAAVDELAHRHPALAEWWDQDSDSGEFEFSFLPTWRAHVPSARALWPLHHPGAASLPFAGASPSEDDWAVLTHTADAIGIRSRAALVTALVAQRFAGRDRSRWLSLGSGSVIALLRALRRLEDGGTACTLEVRDGDLDSRRLATSLAADHHARDAVTAVDAYLYDLEALRDERGTHDLVDIVGFLEYLPTEPLTTLQVPQASDFIAAALGAVRPGGMLLLGNMLSTRPHLDFVTRCIQWPFIQPRSAEELVGLLESAGVSPDRVTLYVPDDGVYAVATVEA